MGDRIMAALAEVPLSAIAAFSASGRLHRAFGHVVAAGAGSLLCVPLHLAAGDLRAVVDACPVPWEEVWAVLDAPRIAPLPVQPDRFPVEWPRLAMLSPYGWQADIVPPFAAGRPEALRFVHASGIRFAQV